MLAPVRDVMIVSCRPGWLVMSKKVLLKVDRRFVKPIQTTNATRSVFITGLAG